jgi:hypothetical protein
MRVRGIVRKRGGNDFKHSRDISQNFVIPKSQDSIVAAGKPLVPNLVPRAVRVLASVRLNDEASLATNEIDGIGTKRLLPNEFEPI